MTKGAKAKLWISRILLAFVLVTIGFAAGRRTASPPPSGSDNSAAATEVGKTAAHHVVVYAAHMTFRCSECNQIEWFARELVENEFAPELAAGKLFFRTVDYTRDTAFSRRYNVSSSTIIVVRIENGDEQNFKRLDEVWTKLRDRDEFFDYVRVAIRDSLEPEDEV